VAVKEVRENWFNMTGSLTAEVLPDSQGTVTLWARREDALDLQQHYSFAIKRDV